MLASRSPQRRAILEQLGIPFRVVEPAYDERDLGVPPAELVVRHSWGKAHSIEVEADEWVLGVDTAVVLDEKVYGKPADEAEAGRMLALLSGRAHEVHSGVTLHRGPGHPDHAFTGHAMTEVRFRRLEPADISDYVATGEWRGRAGGYAIQGRGAVLVERIDGDYLNVVGLPAALLVSMLRGLPE